MKSVYKKHGFTLVETLIALAIAAILMVSVAVAFNASVINFQENEEMFNTMNNARQALTRMTNELRNAGAYDGEIYWAVNPDVNNTTQCQLHTSSGEDITYEYRDSSYSVLASRNRLYVITNVNGNEYLLCDNVAAMNFIKTPIDDGTDCKSVQITMTVQIGDSQRSLSAASVIRKNLQ